MQSLALNKGDILYKKSRGNSNRNELTKVKGGHYLTGSDLFCYAFNVKKTLKEKNMKALKLIREDGYENVHYASLGEQKFKTLVVADRKDEQEQWFEQPEIECVPEEVSDIIRNYTLPYIDLGNTEDEYLLEQATNKVVSVVVENVLETQPFIPRNRNGRPIGEGVAF